MIYQETTIHKIEYSFEDIQFWVRTFSAKKLGINPDEIKDTDIIVNPDNVKDITITVTLTKTSGNQKELP